MKRPSISANRPAEEADAWLALLHSPLFDKPQQQALRRWLDANPANRIALQKSYAFWQKLGTLDATQLALLEQRFAKVTVSCQQNKRKPFPPSIWLMPALVCCLLLLAPGWQFWQSYFADYRTAVGEQQLILLGDGSRVLLNTDSAFSVDFSPQRRLVILHGGEAHFKVAKDAIRSFEVKTDSGIVRALGTAFAVKQMNGDMTVTVDEHTVRVVFGNGKTIEQLREGEQIRLHDQQVGSVATVNLRQAMAWQQQRLVFKDQPLQDVVAELSRYRKGAIVIADRALAQHQVTGVFDADDTETALRTIETSLRLKEYRLTDSLVLLAKG